MEFFLFFCTFLQEPYSLALPSAATWKPAPSSSLRAFSAFCTPWISIYPPLALAAFPNTSCIWLCSIQIWAAGSFRMPQILAFLACPVSSVMVNSNCG